MRLNGGGFGDITVLHKDSFVCSMSLRKTSCLSVCLHGDDTALRCVGPCAAAKLAVTPGSRAQSCGPAEAAGLGLLLGLLLPRVHCEHERADDNTRSQHANNDEHGRAGTARVRLDATEPLAADVGSALLLVPASSDDDEEDEEELLNDPFTDAEKLPEPLKDEDVELELEPETLEEVDLDADDDVEELVEALDELVDELVVLEEEEELILEALEEEEELDGVLEPGSTRTRTCRR